MFNGDTSWEFTTQTAVYLLVSHCIERDAGVKWPMLWRSKLLVLSRLQLILHSLFSHIMLLNTPGRFWCIAGNSVNLLLAGGGRIMPPTLANFLSNSKRVQISTRNLQHLIQDQFGTFIQNVCEILVKLLRKWHLSDVMSRDFGSKNGQFSVASRM